MKSVLSTWRGKDNAVFFPILSTRRGSSGSPPCLRWLSGWSKRLLYLPPAKGASLSVTTDVFTKSGSKGDPVSACVPSLQPDSTKQQILGIITLDSQQKLHSSENKLKREWLKKKKKKLQASREQTTKNLRCSQENVGLFCLPCAPAYCPLSGATIKWLPYESIDAWHLPDLKSTTHTQEDVVVWTNH